MFVPPFYVGRKRIAGSSTTEEQLLRATTAYDASKGVIIFGRTESTPSTTSGTCSTAPSASQGHDNNKSLVPSGVAAKLVVPTSSTDRFFDIKCHRY
jgi:hypothetical protein